MEPYKGTRSGMGPLTGTGSGMGVDLEEGLFDPAGLSTQDRVAAYLAAESGEGITGGRGVAGRGGKRAAAIGGEAVTKVKPKKRKRI